MLSFELIPVFSFNFLIWIVPLISCFHVFYFVCSFFLSLSLSISMSIYLSLSISLSISLYFSLSLSISLYLSLYLYLYLSIILLPKKEPFFLSSVTMQSPLAQEQSYLPSPTDRLRYISRKKHLRGPTLYFY